MQLKPAPVSAVPAVTMPKTPQVPVLPLSVAVGPGSGVSMPGTVQLTATPALAQPGSQVLTPRSVPLSVQGSPAQSVSVRPLVGFDPGRPAGTPQRPPAAVLPTTSSVRAGEPRRSLGPGAVLTALPERQVSAGSARGARSTSPSPQVLVQEQRRASIVTSQQTPTVAAPGMATGTVPIRTVFMEPSSMASGTGTASVGFPPDDSYVSVENSYVSVDNTINDYTFDGNQDIKHVVRRVSDPRHAEKLQLNSSPGLQQRRTRLSIDGIHEVASSMANTPDVPSGAVSTAICSVGRTTPQTPPRPRPLSPLVGDLVQQGVLLNGEGNGGKFDWPSPRESAHEAHDQQATPRSQMGRSRNDNASASPCRSVSADSSKWGRLGAKSKPSWVPAISTPTFFSRSTRSSSRGKDSPPRSACSTPRRRRGQCYYDLYNDAADRQRRRKEKKEELEATEISQIRAERESSLRATRRYQFNDERGVLGRTDELLKRKAERQKEGLREQRRREENEMEECTFQPSLCGQQRESSPERRQKRRDERELERHLRQLAHKQLDVRARLVQLESEWLRVHEKRRELFTQRCKEVETERLREIENLETVLHGDAVVKPHMYVMLGEDQMRSIECAVDSELQVQKLDVDFWARRRVLIESLESIESRAAPTLEIIDKLAEGSTVLESSGFTVGLASKVKLLVPEVENLSSIRVSMSNGPSSALPAPVPSLAALGPPPILDPLVGSNSIHDMSSRGARSMPSDTSSNAVGSAADRLGSAGIPGVSSFTAPSSVHIGARSFTSDTSSIAVGSASVGLGSAGIPAAALSMATGSVGTPTVGSAGTPAVVETLSFLREDIQDASQVSSLTTPTSVHIGSGMSRNSTGSQQLRLVTSGPPSVAGVLPLSALLQSAPQKDGKMTIDEYRPIVDTRMPIDEYRQGKPKITTTTARFANSQLSGR